MSSTTSRLRRLLTSTLPLLGAFVFWCSIAATTTFAAGTDGVITTIAGNGTAGSFGDNGQARLAEVNYPQGAAVDSAGNVYIADTNNHRIRKVTAATGVIITFAGTGTAGFSGDGGLATAAKLFYPSGVAVDQAGNVYIADQFNNRIRQVAVASGVITTVAGSGTAAFGGDGGLATAAQLYHPYGLTLDGAGNIYISDTINERIRKVTAATGIITTIAGNGTAGFNGNTLATQAELNNPTGVAVDGTGNVYIADYANQRIETVTGAGVISTAAGTGVGGFGGEAGPATAAELLYPSGVAVDGTGNVYIADRNNHRIRKITVATGVITTVAGNGTASFDGDGGLATPASLYYPEGLAVDVAGAMYIADQYNQRIRKVAAPTVTTLLMKTVAGNGTAGYNGNTVALMAELNNPAGVAVDGAGNVYVADYANQRIEKVTPAGVISTAAGTGVGGFSGEGGPATAAELLYPFGVAVDGTGNVYIADRNNHRIRKITLATGIINTVAGNGTAGFSMDGVAATASELYFPTGVAVDAAGNLYIADQYNMRIRKVTAATGVISTIAGTGVAGESGDNGIATAAEVNYPQGVAVDGAGNVYIADTNNHRVRKVTAATGVITSFAGTGIAGYSGEAVAAAGAELFYPSGVAVDAGGNVYIADQYNNRIRKVTVGTSVIATVTGSANAAFGGDGGVASSAQLYHPYGVAVDAAGSVYIADTINERVRKAAVQVLPPTTLTAVRSGSAAFVSWTGSAGATSYNLYRGTTSGGETLLASGIVGTTYLDAGVATRTTYYYVVTAVSFGIESPGSNQVSFRLSSATNSGDFDGDGKNDPATYYPATGQWWVLYSSAGYTTNSGPVPWGGGGAIPVPGDYDGDGKTDPAIYFPSTGQWWILYSSTHYTTNSGGVPWGGGGAIPVPGDYDGDGKTDPAIYFPSTGQWWILYSSTHYTTNSGPVSWGGSGAVPVPSDYDGDGKTDPALYFPSTGQWWILYSSTGYTTNSGPVSWGGGGATAVPGDYDGDGKTDPALYFPSTGQWWILYSSTHYTTNSGPVSWGGAGATPLPGDYDGDGKTDPALYFPSTGQWWILYSSTGYTTNSGPVTWGGGGATPIN